MGLPSKLVAKLGLLDFETRKDAATVREEGGDQGRTGREGVMLFFLNLDLAPPPSPFSYQVLGAIFRIDVDGATPGADYLVAHPEVVTELLEG